MSLPSPAMPLRQVRPLVTALTLVVVAACSPDQTPLTSADPRDEPRLAAVQPPGLTSLLDVTLALPSARVSGNGAVPVVVTIANRGTRTVVVPAWMLPADEVEEALFVMQRDGQPVAYVGPDVKRGPLQATDLVRFAGGEVRQYTVDLALAYDLSGNGSYEVAYAIERGVGNTTYRLQSEKAVFTLSERSGATTSPVAGAVPGEVTAQAGSLTYSRCTVTQQSAIATAVANARIYADTATRYLAVQKTEADRFKKWFDPASATDSWTLAHANFTKILDGFTSRPIVVDCGCKKTYYAYVYSNQPYKIFVCKAFWSAPMTGTDSKAGTLIHEMSHFSVVAGTQDYVYGQSLAANLAINDAYKALRNADNHEYFAENTPFLK